MMYLRVASFLVLSAGLLKIGQVPFATGAQEVTGQVLGFDGRPAPGFIVDVVGSGKTSTPKAMAVTDGQGRFDVRNLAAGEYIVVAYQEGASRYPGGTSSFYNPHPKRINLSFQGPTEAVVIRLGPPNRILSGAVVSRQTGAPIPAVISISYPDDGERFIRFRAAVTGEFRVLVPNDSRLNVSISAAGFASSEATLERTSEGTDLVERYQLVPLP